MSELMDHLIEAAEDSHYSDALVGTIVRTQCLAEIRRLMDRLSVPLTDGTRLRVGDCFTSTAYPFSNDGEENYHAELYWDEGNKALFYDIYPVSDRVMGRACGGSIADLDWNLIARRETRTS